jgi:hypothetical protein
MPGPPQIILTNSQLDQLAEYRREKGERQSVLLRPAQSLGSGYVEAVVLDADGELTSVKRILFP